MYKLSPQNKKQKVTAFNGLLLFIISIILSIITLPFGLIYGILSALFKRGFGGVGEFLLEIAISIDQSGNVVMQFMMNHLLIRKDGYKFGNKDETISSVIGKNEIRNTLTRFGKIINSMLDAIEKRHSVNLIDYQVEGNQRIINDIELERLQTALKSRYSNVEFGNIKLLENG